MILILLTQWPTLNLRPPSNLHNSLAHSQSLVYKVQYPSSEGIQIPDTFKFGAIRNWDAETTPEYRIAFVTMN